MGERPLVVHQAPYSLTGWWDLSSWCFHQPHSITLQHHSGPMVLGVLRGAVQRLSFRELMGLPGKHLNGDREVISVQPPGQAHSSVAAFLPAHTAQCWAALPASHCCRYVSFWLAMFLAPAAWKVQGARAPRCRWQTGAALALPTAMRTQTLRYRLLQCDKHGQRQIVGAAVTSCAHWWCSPCLHLDNLAFLIIFFHLLLRVSGLWQA